MALTNNHQQATTNENAFTLLEVLIVLFILGMIAVMAWPALGILDDRAREEITCERMEVIRRSIVGDPDRFDANGRRIIGGYVGDMEKWPDLWEAKADVVPSGCDFNCTCEDPAWDPFSFGFRPAGRFVEKRWKWCSPFRKVCEGGFEYKEPGGAGYIDDKGTPDPADDVYHIGDYAAPDYCKDHIGGLETENEGQPRGLWTDDPKQDAAPTEMEDPDKWKGPYLAPPMDECLKDGLHWAETCTEYMSLEPVDGWVWVGGPPVCERVRTWEDGDCPAEHYDEKESFRLLQTDGRLADGWGRALRFFISADQDRPGSTIFWIISEGPDKEGTYSAKGIFGGAAWVSDSDDIMSKAYDEEDDYNKDNIVMKIYSHEWEAIFEKINEKKKTETEDLFLRIKRAILGLSPGGMNDGFTGDVCRWPKLFRWEGSFWDDKDESTPEVSYTKGQLRELWTRTLGPGDDVAESAWGIGWRHAYFQTPWGFNGEQYIRDAWDREVLFFKDDTNDAIMILFRGVDGKFDFYDTGGNYLEPANYTEAINVTTYNPNDAGGHNADNVVLIVRKSDWRGYFSLNIFTVNNATYNAGTGVYTKARFFCADGYSETRIAGADGSVDPLPPATTGQWVVGPPAFDSSLFANDVATGYRYLVFWDDTNGDDEINTGEMQYTYTYNIITSAGSNQIDSITLDATVDFTAAP
ncbi:MAG: type II secretion system protein [Thermodesulfobacteriota bacterium]|nr:type II secretion system protein [Thermodesulfobacteriota bacterium]